MSERLLLRTVKVAASAADIARPRRHGVIVLLYHRVGAHSGLEVDLPLGLFEDEIAYLSATGRSVSLGDALTAVGSVPPETADLLAVTFDDGTADFSDAALPVLECHRVPVTLYLATAFVEAGRPFPNGGAPISWSALRDALSTGLVTIGSHAHTHAVLDRADRAVAEDEVARSIGLIEDRLGLTPRHFAYPKAVLGSPAAEQAVRERFASAALAGTRVNPYTRTDPYRLSRSPIQVSDGMRFFRRKLEGGMALEGWLRRLLDRRRYASAVT